MLWLGVSPKALCTCTGQLHVRSAYRAKLQAHAKAHGESQMASQPAHVDTQSRAATSPGGRALWQLWLLLVPKELFDTTRPMMSRFAFPPITLPRSLVSLFLNLEPGL
jgi:hypothetical protein